MNIQMNIRYLTLKTLFLPHVHGDFNILKYSILFEAAIQYISKNPKIIAYDTKC